MILLIKSLSKGFPKDHIDVFTLQFAYISIGLHDIVREHLGHDFIEYP